MRMDDADRARRLAVKEHKTPQWNHWETLEDDPLKILLRQRYNLASRVVWGYVVDAACGYGVGTYMLCTQSAADYILGLDNDRNAIEYAKNMFRRLPEGKAAFHYTDLQTYTLPPFCDWLVTLETVEHLPDPVDFLFRAKEKVNGIVLSVPIIATNNPHHCWTHFEPEEVDTWFASWRKVMDERLQEVVGGKMVDRYKVAAYERT